jgi:protein TonB
MKRDKITNDRLRRGGIFLFTAALHVVMLFFIVFAVEVTDITAELPATVMKLADIQEERPPPPPVAPEKPPTPPEELPVIEEVAETFIETDDPPAEAAPVETAPAASPRTSAGYADEYLPQNKVSVVPRLDEKEIRSRLVYPSIALRAGLEGMVYLELYIDREGYVRRIVILKENPAGRGFGEAAVKAFQGMRGKPAQANGEAVAVRYRYPVRFQIK